MTEMNPPSMWPWEEQKTVNTKINEAILRKQEEMFAAWLEEQGLKDYRQMPFSEQRTQMKHRVFSALYGKKDSDG